MAQTDNTTIAGFFEDHNDAERAVQALKNAGFTSAHLGVAHRGGAEAMPSQATTGESVSNTASNAAHAVGEKTEGMWDKVKSFFDGDSVEPYADERQDGDLASREITPSGRYPSDNSSERYGHDDFRQSLSGLSMNEDLSHYVSSRFGANENGAVVTVTAPGREAEAETILRQCGADLGDNAASYDYSSAKTAGATGEGMQNIQLLGEVLRVHKDRVSAGEVNIRKETITDMQTIQVPVTREELVIERRPVAGQTEVSERIGENREIRIPLTEERASAETSIVVREEVSVGKRSVEETRDVTGEVRREELVVDDQTVNRNNR